MFEKLIDIQNRKIEILQTQKHKLNSQISLIHKHINSLKEKSFDNEIGHVSAGSFMASSMHYKYINHKIEELEQELNAVIIESYTTTQKIKSESIDLEKYKHIEQTQKLKKMQSLKELESLEVDEFIQTKYNPNV